MDDFDAEIAENLAATEAVVEQGDRTYVEAINDMFVRLAMCKHTRSANEEYAGGMIPVCLDCGIVDMHRDGSWR